MAAKSYLRNIGWFNELDNLESSYCKTITNGPTVCVLLQARNVDTRSRELNFKIFKCFFCSWSTTPCEGFKAHSKCFQIKIGQNYRKLRSCQIELAGFRGSFAAILEQGSNQYREYNRIP